MRHASSILCSLLPAVLLAGPLAAQERCPADEIAAVAQADTVSVQHWNAERNCCYELDVRFTTEANIIDFYEGFSGEPCRCDCCFNLRYSASGFAPGHYTVGVWNHDGTEHYGSVEVEVTGEANAPAMVTADLGQCVGPTASLPGTWTLVKEIYK